MIVFDQQLRVTVDEEPAELAQLLSGNKGQGRFAGDYLNLTTEEGDSIWVNPKAVAFLER
ncbi:MAG TPA: hypothetical protein VFB25_03110 [Gaiellaceae bacterium]|nr:hypothetical protein [Gaiellaceae bacterium]